MPHWKALSSGKYVPRQLSCGSTLNICQGVLKSANLLHKRGFILFPMASTVHTSLDLDLPCLALVTLPAFHCHLGPLLSSCFIQGHIMVNTWWNKREISCFSHIGSYYRPGQGTLSEISFITNFILAKFWLFPVTLYNIVRPLIKKFSKFHERILRKMGFNVLQN